jgi:type IV pilus assembly protein PilM
MNLLAPIVDPIRRIGLQNWGGLRPTYPPVAVELAPSDLVLVRTKSRRGGRLTLDACQVRPMEFHATPSVARVGAIAVEAFSDGVREAFESTGTRPGKVSLVFPDSMAKVALLTFPERPSSTRQLSEMVRFKLRRAVPFRLEEAAIAFHLLPGDSAEATVLVAAMPRAVVEPYERILEGMGGRPGLVTLCTPSLYNLWRGTLESASAEGDAALLNCTPAYFSLLILRAGRLIFYRCKSLVHGEEGAPEETLDREIASSLSYYQEKLGGTAVATAFVRTTSRPFEDVAASFYRLGVAKVELLDPSTLLSQTPGNRIDPEAAQKIAPALGAVAGWR